MWDQFIVCRKGLADLRTGNAGLHDFQDLLMIALYDCPVWQATTRGHGTVCGGRLKRAKLHGSVLHAMSWSRVILAEDRTIGCWKRGRCRADLNQVLDF